RDRTLDLIYADVRARGTHAQRRFVDEFARSRAEAQSLMDILGPSLAPVREVEDSVEKQLLAAAALFEHRVTPVVMVRIPMGGDNHQDLDLAVEVTEQIAGIESLRKLWVDLGVRGLQDSVTFAWLNVFGRDLIRVGGTGGRGHYGRDHAMVMFGPNVSPGLYGGVVDVGGGKQFLEAGPIGEVPVEETLAFAGKTLARAVGVPETVIDQRIVGGGTAY
ncbi:MAG: DUF1501 domain-containing protein, partial [Myxococcota bacterium]